MSIVFIILYLLLFMLLLQIYTYFISQLFSKTGEV